MDSRQEELKSIFLVRTSRTKMVNFLLLMDGGAFPFQIAGEWDVEQTCLLMIDK